MFFKTAVLESFAIFTGKHLRWRLFSIKSQFFRPASLLKRDSITGFFIQTLRNFSEEPFLENTSDTGEGVYGPFDAAMDQGKLFKAYI